MSGRAEAESILTAFQKISIRLKYKALAVMAFELIGATVTILGFIPSNI